MKRIVKHDDVEMNCQFWDAHEKIASEITEISVNHDFPFVVIVV